LSSIPNEESSFLVTVKPRSIVPKEAE